MFDWLLGLINKRQRQLYQENLRLKEEALYARRSAVEYAGLVVKLCQHATFCQQAYRRIGHYKLTDEGRIQYESALDSIVKGDALVDNAISIVEKRREKKC
ncbi:hypothetical protein pEaSNUABM29_00023 [Erwinia phage pEa_SNUABM_29]|nr:hypothetical protein pEaSNUABM29_00023 [Erwinia phage pEa_SNUABM_29]